MRVTIDRGAEAVRLELSAAAAETRRVEAADGVAIVTDAAGRVVEIEVRAVDPAALHAFTVELAGLADRPAAAAVAPAGPPPAGPPPAGPVHEEPPSPPYYAGPLIWDPEAEAAVSQMPFFTRGQRRLDAGKLARRRGSDRVTVEIVRAVGGR